jgi:4-amino-4-deoxy-L-arabinose transferase-like glycosyltransferase
MLRNILLTLIVLLGFLLRLYVAFMDKFLHPWDERFHALVARNMMHSPFKPMLRAMPVTDNFDPNLWCCNHIWLHKQPLFMWQMAMSMKLLGVSEFSMRLPSVVMGTLAILLLYRIVILATRNQTVALWAAFLLAISSFHLKMIAGIQGMDHNDVALGFYVLASFWAYGEYLRKPHGIWIVLIGLCCGAAILCKWLLGLLVYSAWGFNLLYNHKRIKVIKEWSALIFSVIICVIVFAPWQLYIIHNFPEQAYYEYEFNRRHITEALEGHEGSVFYYIKHLPQLLGNWVCLLPLLGLYLQFKFKMVDKRWFTATLVPITLAFCFFNFIVKTKVETYLFFIITVR